MATAKTKDYLHNSNLLVEIARSKEILNRFPVEEHDDRAAECLTKELVAMIAELVSRLATSFRWRGYTWIEDMKSEALLNLCKVALKFNMEKAGDYPNPFGYYTQIAKRVFLNYIEKEKKQGKIRDEIIEMSDTDLLPSFARQNEEDPNRPGPKLDGTKDIPSDPRLRRRRAKVKPLPGDDTSNMTGSQYKEWLDKKMEEFKQRKLNPLLPVDTPTAVE